MSIFPNQVTLLHLSAQYSSPSVVKVIVDCGADADVCDDDKRTPSTMLLSSMMLVF